MHKTPLVLVLALLPLAAAGASGCKRTRSEPPEAPASLPAPAPAGPSFRRDILPMLATSCAATDGCHGVDATDRVNIDLRESAAYRTLVNQRAELRPAALLVEPGQPARSFLIDKLTRRLVEGEGKPMPLDPETGKPKDPSSVAGFVERTLVPWIEQGARDN